MIQYGEDKYKDQLISLWKFCFPKDSENFIRFYFEKVYKNNETLIYIEKNKVVSSLQMIPYPAKIDETVSFWGYISGAMTHPEFQKKGYMAQLLQASFTEMKKKDYACSFLIPQEDWLFNFYSKYGYEKAFPLNGEKIIESSENNIDPSPIRGKTIKICKSISEVNMEDFYMIYSQLLIKKTNAILKTKQHLDNIIWDFFEDKGVLLYNDWGAAFLYIQENNILIKEILYYNEEICQKFIDFIDKTFCPKKIIIKNNPHAPFLKYQGMIKSLDNNMNVTPDIYMSLMLD